MRLKKVMISLDTRDVQEVLRIDLDGEADCALRFVRKVLASQVKAALQPH